MAEEMSPEQIAIAQRQNCVFCKIIKGEIPSKKVHEDKECIAILDINPANEGHVLLLPKEHYAIMPQVPEKTLEHMAAVAKKISKAALISTLGKSTSIFVANGAAAGQKAPHFMMHIIPRKKDSEFFVIPSKPASPQDLDAVKNALIKKLEQITGKKVTQEKMPEPKVALAQMHHAPALHKAPAEQQMIHDENPIPKKSEETFSHPSKVAKVGIKKEKGYLYYIDEDGDIARAPMSRKKKKEGEEGKPENDNEKKGSDDDGSNDDSDEPSGKPTLDDISRMILGGKR